MNKIYLAIVISMIVGSIVGCGLSIAALQPSINSLQTSNTQLQNTLTNTSTTLANLNSSFTNLQEAYVSASLIDDRLSSTTSHTVKGTVINFGNATASNIVITAKWYNSGASFHQEIITITSLAGRAMHEVSFAYTFSGNADDFQYSITWS